MQSALSFEMDVMYLTRLFFRNLFTVTKKKEKSLNKREKRGKKSSEKKKRFPLIFVPMEWNVHNKSCCWRPAVAGQIEKITFKTNVFTTDLING